MKKVFKLLLIGLITLSLVGCGTSKKESDVTEPANITITIPSFFFEGMSLEESATGFEQEGATDVSINEEEHSITLTISTEQQKELLESMQTGLNDIMAAMVEGEKAVASYISIDTNEEFTEFNIKVDPGLYNPIVTISCFPLLFSGGYYQLYDGVKTEDLDVIVNFINNETNETMDSISLKALMDKINEQ